MGPPSQLLPIKPLDGAAGYSRWKESILLRLRTLGLAHVLLSDTTSGDDDAAAAAAAAAAQWERDDALCRGHILHTLSDRVFALHVHRRTARALWVGLRNAYEALDPKHRSARALAEFEFSPDAPIPEQLAEFEAVAAASGYDLSDPYVYIEASSKVAPLYPEYWMFRKEETMDEVWRIVRLVESYNKWREQREDTEEEEEAAASIVARTVRCYNCGGLGHMARNCAR
ncbi:uncharacterized protein LOC109706543 [Ananas comosus]|uniref:Uncharacterized protein LOC109706543 n=1 Tax=Ananas comosus TaxID=4615 RepID=A0A199VGA8_ANACO|nr:uncharacterized protein LOC109706543 [Ananas comosus]OAY76152.1 hypothetical protein ACMD2_16160 [Ananas comosus]